MEAVPIISGAPFVILLLLIAVLPLTAPKYWDSNRNKAIIAAIVSLPILIFLLIDFRAELVHSLKDYVSFIILLASLYIISGGILMTGDLKATPATNSMFLIVGAIIANLIGTTGASMVLIRPLLRTISERKHTGHIPVFFIFVVSNIGGCLTPIGDPPLFLGYLKGVPFTWTLSLLPEWLVMLGIVMTIFYVWDRQAYRKERGLDLKRDERRIEPLRFSGLINLVFLTGVILAVAFQAPMPWRELMMIAMTVLSLLFTGRKVREQNKFTYHPIIEVAVLFIGIFVTMTPLLMLLHAKGSELGITHPWQFFWLSGGLSSFLDNAPTYLTFFSLAQSVSEHLPAASTVAGVHIDLLRAISCGAVFMGANTYIGNGPNFMVKSIAEEQKVPVPHFFGYMAWSGIILIPSFVIVTLIFFRS